MVHTVILIHTVPRLIDTFNRLGAQLLPEVNMLHILDEVMLERVRQNGGAGEKEKEWLNFQVASALEIHASAVLVTCTILSALVDEIRPTTSIPILKIDEAMITKAVELGERIGMIVTNPDTTEPTMRMIFDYAASVGKSVTVKSMVVAHAFDAVRSGDVETHDILVRKAILDLAMDVDLIVLAQASMARVLYSLPEEARPVPILSSPHLALEQLKDVLEKQAMDTVQPNI